MKSVNEKKILFVDDDPVTGRVMQRHCSGVDGYHCEVFTSAHAALDYFNKDGADLLITDLRMPEMSGFDLLREIRTIDPEIPVLVMTGYSTVDNAVEAMKAGANDFIKKPFDFEELELLLGRTLEAVRLKQENQYLKARLQDSSDEHYGMVGNSQTMDKLYKTIAKVAAVDCNVVITGESGTGKELVARALHDYSTRKGPFVVIDCGALPETLLESELFGHEKGAFTGAATRKHGLMEQANGGTLFLDEVCNIPDAMQMKLMRAIETQRITRVGGTQEIPTDLRIVVASNRDLKKMVEEGRLRHDFYHRLNVVNIRTPSLAERPEDIPMLVEHFIHEFAQRYQREVKGFDAESMRILMRSDWSGNVRQLRNIVERCVILADGPQLSWSGETDAEPGPELIQIKGSEFVSLEELERNYIAQVLRHCDGKKLRAAKVLGIDKTTLWRKLQKYEEFNSVV